jgi:hypothetical protein
VPSKPSRSQSYLILPFDGVLRARALAQRGFRVREEHGEVTETRSNGALALLCFAELIVLHLEALPEIALIPYEHLRVPFIGGLFPDAIRARHPGDADAVAVRQKVLCRLGVCCDAGGGSPLSSFPLYFSKRPSKEATHPPMASRMVSRSALVVTWGATGSCGGRGKLLTSDSLPRNYPLLATHYSPSPALQYTHLLASSQGNLPCL